MHKRLFLERVELGLQSIPIYSTNEIDIGALPVEVQSESSQEGQLRNAISLAMDAYPPTRGGSLCAVNRSENQQTETKAGRTCSYCRGCASTERCACGPATADPTVAAIVSAARPGSAGGPAAGSAGASGRCRRTEGSRNRCSRGCRQAIRGPAEFGPGRRQEHGPERTG